jgi:hypothetical protein
MGAGHLHQECAFDQALRLGAFSFDHLIRALLKKPRHVTQSFRQLQRGRLHDREIGRFCALEDLVGVEADLPVVTSTTVLLNCEASRAASC